MPYKIMTVVKTLDGSPIKAFNEYSSEEDKVVWDNYINNVVAVASELYNRGERNVEFSNTTYRIVSYGFNTLEDAENYMTYVTDISNPYVAEFRTKNQEYSQAGLINTSVTRKIIETS